MAMIRGLKQKGRTQFTDADAESVIEWGGLVRLREALFSLVMSGQIDMVPSPDGDPKEVVFMASARASGEGEQKAGGANGELAAQ